MLQTTKAFSEQRGNLHSPIYMKEVEFVKKSPFLKKLTNQQKSLQAKIALVTNSTNSLRKKSTNSIQKFPENREEETFLNSSY